MATPPVRLSVGHLVKVITGTRLEKRAIWRIHSILDDGDVIVALHAGDPSLPSRLRTVMSNLRRLTEGESDEKTGSDDDNKKDGAPKRWASIRQNGIRYVGKIVNAAMTVARTAASVIEIIGFCGGDPTGGLGGDIMALQATPYSSPLTIDVSKIGSCSKSEIEWLEEYEKALERMMKKAKRRDATIEDKTRAHKAVGHAIRPSEKGATFKNENGALNDMYHLLKAAEDDARQHKMSIRGKEPAPRTLAGKNAESERIKSHRQAASDKRHQEPKRPKSHLPDYDSEYFEEEVIERRALPTSRHEPDPVSSRRSREIKSSGTPRRNETVREYLIRNGLDGE